MYIIPPPHCRHTMPWTAIALAALVGVLDADTLWAVGWGAAASLASIASYLIPDKPPMQGLAHLGGPWFPTWVVRYDSLLVVDTHPSGADSVLVFAGSTDTLREVAALDLDTEAGAYLIGHRVVVDVPGDGSQMAVIDLEAPGGPAVEQTLDLGSFGSRFQHGDTLILRPPIDSAHWTDGGVVHRLVEFDSAGAYVGMTDITVDGFITGSVAPGLVAAVVPLWKDPGGGIRLLDPAAGWAPVWTFVDSAFNAHRSPVWSGLVEGDYLFLSRAIFKR